MIRQQEINTAGWRHGNVTTPTTSLKMEENGDLPFSLIALRTYALFPFYRQTCGMVGEK